MISLGKYNYYKVNIKNLALILIHFFLLQIIFLKANIPFYNYVYVFAMVLNLNSVKKFFLSVSPWLASLFAFAYFDYV